MKYNKFGYSFLLILALIVATASLKIVWAADFVSLSSETKTGTVSDQKSFLMSEVLTSTQAIPGGMRSIFEQTSADCATQNIYNYSFKYGLKKMDSAQPVSKINKCDQINLIFYPIADWGSSMSMRYTQRTEDVMWPPPSSDHSPSADFLSCTGADDCMSKAKEYQLTPDTWGKGAQQVSANFVSETQNTLAGNSPTITCQNGICSVYSGGNYVLNTSVAQSNFYAQCRGFGLTLNTPGVTVPVITSNLNLNVVNLSPKSSVAFSKDNIAQNEEVTATCDIADPDCQSDPAHQDKIVKVKWSCFDYKGQSTDCYFGKDGIWTEGNTTEEIAEETATNPYRSTVKFKSPKEGGFAVLCEGSDNDVNSQSSGIGVAGVAVKNPNNTNSNDNGVIAASMKFCSVLSDSGMKKTVCGDKATLDYKAYAYGVEPDQYEWKCKKDDSSVIRTESANCSYDKMGTYAPTLRVHDKKSNSWLDCSSANVEAKITNQNSCKVLVRISGSKSDFGDSQKSYLQNQIEAKVIGECINPEGVTWSTDNGNGTKISQNKNKSLWKFSSAVPSSIKASIGGTQCAEAKIDVSDKVNWGNN